MSDAADLPLIGAAALRARAAARVLRTLPTDAKDAALTAMADALVERTDEILAANAADVEAARADGTPESVLDRLRLDAGRVAGVADALRQLVALPDPVGDVVRGSRLPNGLQLRQVRVPLGVVGIVYEARPNVTVDAAGLCLKSGNAALLRGSASAFGTNTALVAVLTEAGTKAGLPEGFVELLPADRASVGRAAERPRPGRRRHPAGRCLADRAGRPRVDRAGDRDRRRQLPRLRRRLRRPGDGRGDRAELQDPPGERLQLRGDAARAPRRPVPAAAARRAGRRRGDAARGRRRPRRPRRSVVPATDEDWATEYLSMDMAVRVVDDLPAAVDHIAQWGSGHSEAIVADSATAIADFTAGVDAAAVLVNASTRFTDGGEFGFGAEIGISTQKLHARGPLGLPELTSTTYVVTGTGHTR